MAPFDSVDQPWLILLASAIVSDEFTACEEAFVDVCFRAAPALSRKYVEVELLAMAHELRSVVTVSRRTARHVSWGKISELLRGLHAAIPDPVFLDLERKATLVSQGSGEESALAVDVFAMAQTIVTSIVAETRCLSQRLSQLSLTFSSVFPFAS